MGWHAFAKYIFIFLIFDEITSILSLLLLIYLALNSSVPGIGFSFFEKGVYLIGFFCFSFKESIDFGTSRKDNTVKKPPESSQNGY